MSELLTVKEVQGLLKIDRITVYRMLKDGRLTGVKIGHQWRFSRHEIDSLLSAGLHTKGTASTAGGALPIHCIQMIQNVFSEMAQVGAVTTGPEGEPLTEFSNSCSFCNLVLSTAKGRKGCLASWRRLSEQKERQPHFATCHAGLQHARARVEVNSEPVAMLVAGQFYADPPDTDEGSKRIKELSAKYGIDYEALALAARDLPVLEESKRAELGKWLESMARTFEAIGRERAELVNRLQNIAAMSTLETN